MKLEETRRKEIIATKQKERRGKESTAQREKVLRKDRKRHTARKRRDRENKEAAQQLLINTRRETERRTLQNAEDFRKIVDAEKHREALILEDNGKRDERLFCPSKMRYFKKNFKRGPAERME